METPIVTRSAKGAALTHVEMDTNLINLQQTADEAHDAIVSPVSIGNLMNPLLHMPLKNDLKLVHGVGSPNFSRATTATYVDRYGVVKTAAIDEPRFEKEGLLIEGASTNLLRYSSDMQGAAWYTDVDSTITNESAGTAPDNISALQKVVTNGTGAVYNYQGISGLTPSTAYTFSLWAKSEDTFSWAIYDSTNSNFIVNSTNIPTLDNTLKRHQITFTTPSNCTSIRVYYLRTAAALTAYFWGSQLEKLPFASSYIPTVDTSVTRASEFCNVPGYNNYDPVRGVVSVLIDFDTISSVALVDRYIYSIKETNYIMGIVRTTGNIDAYNPLRLQLVGKDTTVKNRICSVSDGSKNYFYLNGELELEGDSSIHTFTSVRDFALGESAISASDHHLFGHVSNFRIYDKALTAAEMRVA
jgi:hypothetical protein